jgi:hypothetical protein
MGTMYIRVKRDGFIYEYNEILAKNPGCEVVSEEVAFPERFVPAHAKERVEAFQKAKGTRKKSTLNLATADIPEPPPHTSPELAEEATRRLPR